MYIYTQCICYEESVLLYRSVQVIVLFLDMLITFIEDDRQCEMRHRLDNSPKISLEIDFCVSVTLRKNVRRVLGNVPL